jgi:hypothetical protein
VDLPDLIAVGLLLQAFPLSVVDEILRDNERREGRRRLLPARLVVYDVMAMGLFPEESYELVMRTVSAGVAWASGQAPKSGFPSKVALARARTRLGSEPMRALFEWAAQRPVGAHSKPELVTGRVVQAITATRIEVADTAANADVFGRRRAGGSFTPGAPQARIVGLVQSGPNALVDLAIGPLRTTNRDLATRLTGSLRSGTLLVVDQSCLSPALWDAAAGAGVAVLWPANASVRAAPGDRLPDGSYLSSVHATAGRRALDAPPLPVRVIEYDGATSSGSSSTRRLMTTLLDPVEGAASDLVDALSSSVGLPAIFETLTAGRVGDRLTVRSKTPDGVAQEIYGLVCLYHALRPLLEG